MTRAEKVAELDRLTNKLETIMYGGGEWKSIPDEVWAFHYRKTVDAIKALKEELETETCPSH